MAGLSEGAFLLIMTVSTSRHHEKLLSRADLSTGECKQVMTKYLNCIKKVKGMNDPVCRDLAKSYLSCRMER
jgi:hypothetical protein